MKTKHTVYLPQSTLELLDGIWLELRAAFKSRQVTKSMIVELAIEVSARELQEHGAESRLHEAMKIHIEPTRFLDKAEK
jgi:hypothetical protein